MSPSDPQPRVVSVTVTGCLNGSRLEPTPRSLEAVQRTLPGVTTFVLQGPRAVMRSLTRDHNGHHETITGVVIIASPPEDATADTESVTRGQTTTGKAGGGTGTGKVSPASANVQDPVRIRVQSARHVSDHCAPRR